MVDRSDFVRLGRKFTRKDKSRPLWPPSKTERRRFKSMFGVGPEVCTIVFSLVVDHFNLTGKSANPLHFLWSLLLLKVYSSETVHCALAGGADEKSFREESWTWVRYVAELSYDLVSNEINTSCIQK